jgi:flagellar biosynthesis component FlhA
MGMPKQAVEVFNTVKRAHEEIYKALKELKVLASQTVDIRDLADIAHAINQAQQLTADTDKDFRLTLETVKKALCVMWTRETDATGEPIRTLYVTASPSVKMMLSVPSRKTDYENYEKLMRSLNIPEHLWNQPVGESAIVQVHFPGFVEYVSGLVERGEQLPEGCDPKRLVPIYKVTLTSRKEVGQYTEED